jgi:hypothetical protein
VLGKKKKRTLICGPTNRLSLAEQDFTGENFGRRKIISNSHRKTLWPVFLLDFSAKMTYGNYDDVFAISINFKPGITAETV